ncbi:poly(A) RNA polymerase gld-2 homolog A-like [Rhagoletis pomonella]|uniref:poly(A) RNA polymerase gld-2 homolog A-like n=1 Tax=Rhagoletis pomonella TaxID=28610 RepID=UPI00177DB6A4|nr:poly(A) RNA polymerase gld-2 homolog A-like [Rhagoletis pomonella]XP_036345552.1 poly(A) RNA polymerase gld-2 homolog A-like [Rhagoletis pomonella]
MVATLNSGGSLRQRSGGRSQQQGLQNHQMAAPPPASISHVYPQHNLLYGGPPTHIRSTANSPHDYFTHTPPDRFLARAHLVEAKEAPSTLLNNSKWDNLSQGVWNKFINSQQTEETFKQKMRLWRYLYIIVKNTYPRFGLYLVGSTISGFGADTSDVDMCLVSRSSSSVEPRMEALFNLTVLRDYLSKSAEFENFNLIEAKVPILRFRDRIHQLEVDLNFNNCVGIKNTHLLYCYSQLDWRLRPMVLVTKLWAQYHNINNAKNMTISSYSLVLMVIHFLQYAVSPAVLPCLHELFPDKFTLLRSNDFGYVDMNETIGSYESKNTQSIGELFLYAQFAISIRTGGILPINVCRLAKSSKNDIHQWKELCIEEPFDLTNTARSVYDFETFERVKAVFMASWRMLQQTLDLNAVFAPIILPALHHIVSPLSHTVLQYEDSNVSTASETSTRENTTHGSDQNSGTNPSPTVTLLALTNESNKHASKEINNNNNSGNSNTVGGSRTELVS